MLPFFILLPLLSFFTQFRVFRGCLPLCLRMIPHEWTGQIRRLHLKARRAVENLLGGEYHSVFKGTGIAFEEVRGSQPGDGFRSIDGNVTARMGHPFVKRFIEERELTVMLLVDTSASQ